MRKVLHTGADKKKSDELRAFVFLIGRTLTSYGKTIDMISPAAVITNEGSEDLGDQKGNIIRLNSDSPSGTISHEVLHSLGLDDNGYTSGGILNSPPEPIKSSEVDLTIKFSFEKCND